MNTGAEPRLGSSYPGSATEMRDSNNREQVHRQQPQLELQSFLSTDGAQRGAVMSCDVRSKLQQSDVRCREWQSRSELEAADDVSRLHQPDADAADMRTSGNLRESLVVGSTGGSRDERAVASPSPSVRSDGSTSSWSQSRLQDLNAAAEVMSGAIRNLREEFSRERAAWAEIGGVQFDKDSRGVKSSFGELRRTVSKDQSVGKTGKTGTFLKSVNSDDRVLQVANPGDGDGDDRVSWQSLDSDIHIRRRRPMEVQLRSSRSGQADDRALRTESWSRRRSITGREVEQWTEVAEEDNRSEVHMESSGHDVGVSELQSTRSMETQPRSSPVEDEDHLRQLHCTQRVRARS